MTKAEEVVALIDELGYEENPYWGDGGLDDSQIEYNIVQSKTVDKRRWFFVEQDILDLKDGSFVAIEYYEPATEMQEGQPYEARAYIVEPYEVTVTKYRKV